MRVVDAPLDLATPIVLASGPAGFGEELCDLVDYTTVGALTTKTITPEPRTGNPQPRLVDCPSGLLNSIGLENPGLEAFIDEALAAVLTLPTRRIVSLAARDPDALAAMAERLATTPGIDGFELNLSCPNVDEVIVGAQPRLVGTYVRAVRRVVGLPLLAKLPGDAGSMLAAAEAALRSGADGLTLINAVRGLRIDHQHGRPILHRCVGGLTGPAILPIALARVYEARRAFPRAFIIGTGGVTGLSSLVEMLVAGADAVGIGTGIMANPGMLAELVDGLERWLDEHRFATLGEVVGSAHRGGFGVS